MKKVKAQMGTEPAERDMQLPNPANIPNACPGCGEFAGSKLKKGDKCPKCGCELGAEPDFAINNAPPDQFLHGSGKKAFDQRKELETEITTSIFSEAFQDELTDISGDNQPVDKMDAAEKAAESFMEAIEKGNNVSLATYVPPDGGQLEISEVIDFGAALVDQALGKGNVWLDRYGTDHGLKLPKLQHVIQQLRNSFESGDNVEKLAGLSIKSQEGFGSEDFINLVKSQLNIGDRHIAFRNESKLGGLSYADVYVNYINLPESVHSSRQGGGAESENNRMSFWVYGFGKETPHSPPPTGKVQVKLHNSVWYREFPFRAKTGKPEVIAQYLSDYINKIAKEIPPKYTHTKIEEPKKEEPVVEPKEPIQAASDSATAYNELISSMEATSILAEQALRQYGEKTPAGQLAQNTLELIDRLSEVNELIQNSRSIQGENTVAKKLEKEARMSDTDILEGMARCLWATAWADYGEKEKEMSKEQVTQLEGMPEPAPEAFEKASELYAEIETTNNADLAEFAEKTGNLDLEDFGFSLARESVLGRSNLSSLKLPKIDFSMSEVANPEQYYENKEATLSTPAPTGPKMVGTKKEAQINSLEITKQAIKKALLGNSNILKRMINHISRVDHQSETVESVEELDQLCEGLSNELKTLSQELEDSALSLYTLVGRQ